MSETRSNGLNNSPAAQTEAPTISAKTSSEHEADKGNAAEDEQLWTVYYTSTISEEAAGEGAVKDIVRAARRKNQVSVALSLCDLTCGGCSQRSNITGTLMFTTSDRGVTSLHANVLLTNDAACYLSQLLAGATKRFSALAPASLTHNQFS